MMQKILDWLGEIPTTNARIVLTLFIILGTAVKYWAVSTWIPDGNWLTFLAALAGIDATHFLIKRATAWKPEDTPPPTSPTN